VAAMKKWNVPIPSDPKELYELDLEEYAKKGNVRIDSTPTLRYKFHHSFSAILMFDLNTIYFFTNTYMHMLLTSDWTTLTIKFKLRTNHSGKLEFEF